VFLHENSQGRQLLKQLIEERVPKRNLRQSFSEKEEPRKSMYMKDGEKK